MADIDIILFNLFTVLFVATGIGLVWFAKRYFDKKAELDDLELSHARANLRKSNTARGMIDAGFFSVIPNGFKRKGEVTKYLYTISFSIIIADCRYTLEKSGIETPFEEIGDFVLSTGYTEHQYELVQQLVNVYERDELKILNS